MFVRLFQTRQTEHCASRQIPNVKLAMMSHRFRFAAAALVTFTVAASICSAPGNEATEPTWPTNEWQTSTPEEQGMDSKELTYLVDSGARRILATPGTTMPCRFDSLLVVRHGKIVLEVYYIPTVRKPCIGSIQSLKRSLVL
jgi:hypothetical protein